MCVHATDVVPRLGTSSSFCPDEIMKKYYRKQCILQHHEINDRT